MSLKTGISGLRGTVVAGEPSLTPTVVVQWVQAFVGWLQATHGPRPVVVLGRDARCSSPAVAALARGALLAAGADVVELGLTLTPTVQLLTRQQPLAAGGLMVTASHNPIVWNGLKFLDGEGFFLPAEAWADMQQRVVEGALPTAPLDALGRVLPADGPPAWQQHHHAVAAGLAQLGDGAALIRARRLRVALDACNGGAARWADFLAALGCEVLLLHSEPHGFFAREAEPLPQHLGALCALVRRAGCDLGLAADPDGDRLVLVDGRGMAVSEEQTVVLAALAVAQQPGDRVVVNVVTTHAIEEALPHAEIVRTAVGEMNVMAGIATHQARLGGEGSGGIIFPAANRARDGLAAAALVLALMAQRGAPLHDLVAALPPWQPIKGKLTAERGSPDALRALFALWQQQPPEVRLSGTTLRADSGDGSLSLRLEGDELWLAARLPDGEQFTASGEGSALAPLFAALDGAPLDRILTDGLKVQARGGWLSLRPSNTEPIVRVMGEQRLAASEAGSP